MSDPLGAALHEAFGDDDADDVFGKDDAVARSAEASEGDTWDAPLPLDALLAATGGRLADQRDFGTLPRLTAFVERHAQEVRKPAEIVDRLAFDTTPPMRWPLIRAMARRRQLRFPVRSCVR